MPHATSRPDSCAQKKLSGNGDHINGESNGNFLESFSNAPFNFRGFPGKFCEALKKRRDLHYYIIVFFCEELMLLGGCRRSVGLAPFPPSLRGAGYGPVLSNRHLLRGAVRHLVAAAPGGGGLPRVPRAPGGGGVLIPGGQKKRPKTGDRTSSPPRRHCIKPPNHRKYTPS